MASERKFVAENVRRVLLKEYLMKEVLPSPLVTTQRDAI